MGSLENLIRSAHAEIDALEKDALRIAQSLDRARIRLAAFEEAAQEIGLAPQESPQDSGRGRPIGSFSPEWKKVVVKIADAHRPGYARIFVFAREAGIKSSEDAIRDRIRSYVKTGLLKGDAERGFLVDRDKATARGIFEPKVPPLLEHPPATSNLEGETSEVLRDTDRNAA
jgi:hypothetical protein